MTDADNINSNPLISTNSSILNTDLNVSIPSNISPLSSTNLITIKFLLISGKKAKFTFNPNMNFKSIKECILKNWPQEWILDKGREGEGGEGMEKGASNGNIQVSNIQNLRIVYQGHFVSEDTILSSLGLPRGHSTTMHLLITDNCKREIETKNVNKVKKREGSPQPSCIGCIIL